MKIKLFSAPILREVSTVVTEYDPASLGPLIKDMAKAMYKEEGIGLAANQIGDKRAVCIMDTSEDRDPNQVKVFINPQITGSTAEYVRIEESCLSIPGVFAETERFKEVTVKYNKVDGSEVQEVLKGIEAIAIQHEVDHLNGKLFVDMLGPVKKNLVISKCKKFLKAKQRGVI